MVNLFVEVWDVIKETITSWFFWASPSRVMSEELGKRLDPDESLSAAFKAAFRTELQEADYKRDIMDEARQAIIIRNAQLETKPLWFFTAAGSAPVLLETPRLPCQFCGQPGERMTVCRHCGGRVG